MMKDENTEDILSLKKINREYEESRDYFFTNIYEWGRSETIYHVGKRKFVPRESELGEEAEDIQSERAFKTWYKKEQEKK